MFLTIFYDSITERSYRFLNTMDLIYSSTRHGIYGIHYRTFLDSIPLITMDQNNRISDSNNNSNTSRVDDINAALDIQFDINWQDTVLSKQTVFPVYKHMVDTNCARKGAPPENIPYTLRVTKKVWNS